MPNPFTAEQFPQPPKVLKGLLEITAQLRPLQEHHVPLIVRFSERNQVFRSYLIAADRQNASMALDEIIPRHGERYFANGEVYQVECFHEGARISWCGTQTLEVGELDGKRCYRTAIPDALVYHQRRNAYRAMPREYGIRTLLEGEGLSSPLAGKMLDISATGCRLGIPGNQLQRFAPGQFQGRLSAELPGGRLEAAVELRHMAFDEPLDMTVCGLRYQSLSGLAQRQVERLVYQLQREARRDQSDERFS